MKVLRTILIILLVLAVLLVSAVAVIGYKPYMIKQRLTELHDNGDIGFFDQYHKEARAELRTELEKTLDITLKKDFLQAFQLSLYSHSQFEGHVVCDAFIVICSSSTDAELLDGKLEELADEYDDFSHSRDGRLVFFGERYLLQFFGQ